ncbi:hypothetical protein [Streptomyces caniscabiei]|nr:hypothetical protein [Streptomyces caniscabiei]MDX2986519.1 hypothetical protein [Streptomyces caniscabiei]
MKTRLARLRARITAYAGQCSICQGWFDDWPGGICAACQATGRT